MKFELQVDRDRGETIRGDQWVQPTESIRIVGLWILQGSHAEGWNPLKEGNHKKVDFKGKSAFVLLCLCAIVPLCLAPKKTKIAKQVPARCGKLVELHLNSDGH